MHHDFHFVPMGSAGRPRLVSELRRLGYNTDHYRSLYVFTDESAYVPMNAEHRAICEACLARCARCGAAERQPSRARARADGRRMGVGVVGTGLQGGVAR